jgi:glycosyltransferase involved in cell wall biosynthesis
VTNKIKKDSAIVSVIIPTYNRKNLLRETIVSLFGQSYPKDKYEIIVVDDGSTDGTEHMIGELRKDAPCKFKYFKKDNEGPAAARNLGIKNAEGEIIAFTDSDCTTHPDWLKNGLKCFSKNDVAFVSGQKLPKPNQPISFFAPFHDVKEEHPVYPTLNIFYRKEVLISFGGFDERFWARKERSADGEDVELAWRVKRQGLKNVFSKDVIVYHEVFRVTLYDFLIKNTWRLRRVPFIVREVPELREELLFLRVFTDAEKPFIYISVLGIFLAVLYAKGLILLLVLPHVCSLLRMFINEIKTLERFFKVFGKIILIFVRDFISVFVYVYGSIRYRSIVL